MTSAVFNFPKTFISKARDVNIPVTLLKKSGFDAWLKKQSEDVKLRAANCGFSPSGKQAFALYTATSDVSEIIIIVNDAIDLYDAAKGADALRGLFASPALQKTSFDMKTSGLKARDIEQALIGFALSNYVFDAYKKSSKEILVFTWPKDADKKRVTAYTEAAFMLRNMINIPANDMGPDEMEATASAIAESHKATIKVIKGAKLEKDFPLIHTVGKGSPRAPRLFDISWGKPSDPKLVLVGKGVVFDTGGLDIKPSAYMRLMKKDMGGAAHALGLARMIMDLKLPVHLRVLIPCVENAVGGASFRPGDIIKSRKGLTVENTNTDAEGRLILADSLTLASEDAPDMIIDFATLTGSARAALGPDIPAMFSNSDKVAEKLQKISMTENDPLWRMPLWDAYSKTIESPDADLINSAGVPGDLIYSAIFLQKFLVEDKNTGAPDWVHLDVFAWENNGRAGRAKGGTDMSLRAVYAYLEERYGKK